MFKFVEKKGFLYTCIIISVIITCSSFFNYKQLNFILLCTNILLLFPLLGLLFFSNKNNKELMKVLLTSLIICTIFSFLQKFYRQIYWIPITIAQRDQIRDAYNLFLLIAALICVCTMFINHCIMNYTNMPSKIAINLNKIIVILLIIILIADKCSWFFFTSANQLNINIPFDVMRRYFRITFLALTIVSAEAFINSKRAEREANAPAK